ncbi:uncharacterized protein F5147DRAFT_77695 [Suillus discolor]|uniref:Fungal-type protein kinase domain-containing protein n=1 Tax=Suillus discolor TaxID=1912936 RepID=A0A9P7JLI9_9AGAM|nr:uncharacterized protein F5147DRAFT_77695 [Suillus discolor]KAG2086388.1 hypothetical protein F5147DRAFT_77695 [Suillus discolor]
MLRRKLYRLKRDVPIQNRRCRKSWAGKRCLGGAISETSSSAHSGKLLSVILTLWKNGVRDSNANFSNLVVYRTSGGQVTGVFSNFALSSTRDISLRQERARIVPFAAPGVLSGITKTVIEDKHLYQHDNESFIWVLTWVLFSLQKWQAPEKGKVARWMESVYRLNATTRKLAS